MLALAGALVDTDNAHLPGACAGPDEQFGDGAVNHRAFVSGDWSNATLGRVTEPCACIENSQALSTPKFPRQANAGERQQPVRCMVLVP